MSKKINWWIWGTIAVIAVGGFYTWYSSQQPGKYDEFAQCITDKGAAMYGAFWCPHCATQKTTFGKSFKFVNYIECSKPDRTQTEACDQANISSYPTWEFADGSRQTGELSILQLAQRTGCQV